MPDENALHIVTDLELPDGDLSELKVDGPFGVIQDHTYTGSYHLVRWPEGDEK